MSGQRTGDFCTAVLHDSLRKIRRVESDFLLNAQACSDSFKRAGEKVAIVRHKLQWGELHQLRIFLYLIVRDWAVAA